MNQVLLASHNGQLYKAFAHSLTDIAELVRARESDLENLTSTDGTIDFWFTPSTHPAHWRINEQATEILLTHTRFTAKTVPLLRGIVVIASHTATGQLTGLTDDRLAQLAETTIPWPPRITLSRRYAREKRRQHRRIRARDATALRDWYDQLLPPQRQ